MDNKELQFSKHNKYYLVVLIILLVLGFVVRMIDLKDPPLDFHPTRQLRAAVIARSIYLQMAPDSDPEFVDYATDPALYDYVTRREPPITEGIVAILYLIIGDETLWVSRIVTAVFWCLGGLGLYFLVEKLANKDAALISLGFYLFNPFGVIASRSFQPESLMVASMIWSLLMIILWVEKRNWKTATLTGLTIGFTILVKPNPLFLLLPVFVLLILSSEKIKNVIKDTQIWMIGTISVLIPFVFYFFINPAAGGFLNNFWLDIRTIIPTPQYLLGWGSIITDIVPFSLLILALVGMPFYDKKGLLLSLGMWVGYFLLGVFVPHHIYTHNYYSIILVPMVAICLGRIAHILAESASTLRLIWKIGLIGLALVAIAYPTWNVYKELNENDYRNEPQGWEKISEALPDDQRVIALTHNYGFNLAYYGNRMVANWPYVADLSLQEIRGTEGEADFDSFFDAMTDTYDLFLVTHFGELNAQPQLKAKLEELTIFGIVEGYVIYDLSSN